MELAIEDFYKKIPNKENMSAGKLLPYLVYFLEENLQIVSAGNLKNCFLALKMKPYSNISAWLSKNSKGKQAILITDNSGYKLERNAYLQIKENVNGEIEEVPSEEFLPRNLIVNAVAPLSA